MQTIIVKNEDDCCLKMKECHDIEIDCLKMKTTVQKWQRVSKNEDNCLKMKTTV